MATARNFELDGDVNVTGDLDAGASGDLAYDDASGVLSAPQLAPTDAAPTTPTLGRLYGDGLLVVRAVVSTSGGTPSLDADVNVSGIVDNGVGDVTVTFATAYGSTAYSAVPAAVNTGQNAGAHVHSKASGSVRVLTNDNSATPADRAFDLIVMG